MIGLFGNDPDRRSGFVVGILIAWAVLGPLIAVMATLLWVLLQPCEHQIYEYPLPDTGGYYEEEVLPEESAERPLT